MRKGGNLRRGERHEAKIENRYKRNGWKVQRKGWGSDFVATRGSRRVYIECKTGTGRLTERQQAKRRSVGAKNYRVYRHGKRM